MGKLPQRARGAFIALLVEFAVAGVWAFIDADFVSRNKIWFLAVGILGLIAIWFFDQIREFISYKKLVAKHGLQFPHRDDEFSQKPIRWMPLDDAYRYIGLQ